MRTYCLTSLKRPPCRFIQRGCWKNPISPLPPFLSFSLFAVLSLFITFWFSFLRLSLPLCFHLFLCLLFLSKTVSFHLFFHCFFLPACLSTCLSLFSLPLCILFSVFPLTLLLPLHLWPCVSFFSLSHFLGQSLWLCHFTCLSPCRFSLGGL